MLVGQAAAQERVALINHCEQRTDDEGDGRGAPDQRSPTDRAAEAEERNDALIRSREMEPATEACGAAATIASAPSPGIHHARELAWGPRVVKVTPGGVFTRVGVFDPVVHGEGCC